MLVKLILSKLENRVNLESKANKIEHYFIIIQSKDNYCQKKQLSRGIIESHNYKGNDQNKKQTFITIGRITHKTKGEGMRLLICLFKTLLKEKMLYKII